MATAGCLNLLGFRDEGSMILPSLERIRGRVKGFGGGAEGLLDLGVEETGEAPSWAAETLSEAATEGA